MMCVGLLRATHGSNDKPRLAVGRQRMPVDPERLREELRRMRVLIEKDPATRTRFDTDGNGVIDGDEWEQVWQLVIRDWTARATS